VKVVPLVAAAAAVGWVVWRRHRLGRVEIGFWLVVAAGCFLYGMGVVHPPSAEKIIKQVGSTLGKWTYLVVGLLAFLETGAFVGLVAPGEATILLGGFVAGQGKISYVVLLALVWFAAVAGDVTSYFLGRRLGREFLLRHGERLKLTHERLERIEGFFERYGGAAILIGRFVGLIRAFAPFIAGASKLPFSRFLPYDVVGAGIWGCGLVTLGYVFWKSFDQLLALAKQGALALGFTIALIVGAVAGGRWIAKPENRRAARTWLEARPWGRRIVLPAGRFALWVAPGRFGIEVMTLLAITSVGAFTFGALANQVNDAGPIWLDRRVVDMVDPLQTSFLVDVAKVVTALGSLPAVQVIVIACAMWLFLRRRIPEGIALVAGTVLVVAGSNIAKAAVDRPRPSGSLISLHGSAYPSGHAAYAIVWVAVAVALARITPGVAGRLAIVIGALVVAAAIGLTRVYLDAHWFTDVLGGWALGAACFGLVGLLVLVASRLRHNEAT
jgi:membrane protein DedA with SNARE-associated domain/membrane-associated phospholipid phosphatase